MFRSTVIVVLMFCIFETTSSTSLKKQLEIADRELRKLNALSAETQWEIATSGNSHLTHVYAAVNEIRTNWKWSTCQFFSNFIQTISLSNPSLLRAIRLLCMGPSYSTTEASIVTKIQSKLRRLYQESRIFINGDKLGIEPDLAKLMGVSRDPNKLLSVWLQWHETVGPPSRNLYTNLVSIMNQAAWRNGYQNIGECWKEELEINNLEGMLLNLYEELRPFYEELHAVVRYRLRAVYGDKLITAKGPLPVHLLGNMWGQSWINIFDIVYNGEVEPTLSDLLIRKDYTVMDLVLKAEDMFTSLGFPAMSHIFWEKSSFLQNNGTCHGMAANMFQDGDYRMLMCASVSEEDFHVIHHEMGHIEYFMAYKDLPTIFQDGANSAVHEAIGETIMMASSTFAHNERLGLVSGNSKSTERDMKYLLKLALSLLPQMPFALSLDLWRWRVFSGDITPSDYNSEWWRLRALYQGIRPPLPRSEHHFDPASKFHIIDNTPYIRYFLAGILQFQLFEAMCKGAVFQNSYTDEDVPFSLHKCDVYGSKQASTTLRLMMSKGRTINWEEAVLLATGTPIQTQSLLKFFKPLRVWLQKQIADNQIPVGWNTGSYDL